MSPTMSPSKSDKNQPSKYIILAPMLMLAVICCHGELMAIVDTTSDRVTSKYVSKVHFIIASNAKIK